MGGGRGAASSVNLFNQCFQSIEEITEVAVEIAPVEDDEGEEDEDEVADPAGIIEAVNDGKDDGVADNEISEIELRLNVLLKVLLYK